MWYIIEYASAYASLCNARIHDNIQETKFKKWYIEHELNFLK